MKRRAIVLLSVVVFVGFSISCSNIFACSLEIGEKIQQAKESLAKSDFDSALHIAMDAEKECSEQGHTPEEISTVIRLAFGQGAIVSLGSFIDNIQEAISNGGLKKLKKDEGKAGLIASLYVASQIYIGQYNKCFDLVSISSPKDAAIYIFEREAGYHYNNAKLLLEAENLQTASHEIFLAWRFIHMATKIFLCDDCAEEIE